MPDTLSGDRLAHDLAAGSILMRCPVCHASRYVSEFIVTVRKEPQRCPACTGAPSYLEIVPSDDQESPAHRLRSGRRNADDTGSRVPGGEAEVN